MKPISIEFRSMNWNPHPTIQGVEAKVFENLTGKVPKDVLLARVEAGQEIPWHVHEHDTEIGYVLEGAGELHYAHTEAREEMFHIAFAQGQAVVVSAGLWHSVINTGPTSMLIFALHTPFE